MTSAPPAPEPTPAGPARSGAGPALRRSTRDPGIDVLRGWFVISMTVSHLAYGSLAHAVTHAAVWLDGAIGFVTFAGLVMGMVYRRSLERTGELDWRKVLRRVRLLYVLQVTILVGALLVRSLSSRWVDLQPPETYGGWARTLWLVATLRLPAPGLDVLPMYVVLLLAAVPALLLLARGRVRTVLVVSAVVYAAALRFPDVATPDGVTFNWATWQLPFVLGLVVGWSWRELRIAEALRTPVPLAVAAAAAGTCAVLAQLFGRFQLLEGGSVERGVSASFSKFDLGPGVVVFGLGAMVLGYVGVAVLRDVSVLRPLWTWLALLGSRSLDAFVILCLGVVLLPALLDYRPSGTLAMLFVGLTLLAQTAWIVLRRRGSLPGLATGTAVPARALSGRRRADGTRPAALAAAPHRVEEQQVDDSTVQGGHR